MTDHPYNPPDLSSEISRILELRIPIRSESSQYAMMDIDTVSDAKYFLHRFYKNCTFLPNGRPVAGSKRVARAISRSKRAKTPQSIPGSLSNQTFDWEKLRIEPPAQFMAHLECRVGATRTSQPTRPFAPGRSGDALEYDTQDVQMTQL